MSFLFGSLFALALAFVAAQPTTDIDPNSTTTTTTTTTTITTTAPVFDQSSDLAGGLTGDQERKGEAKLIFCTPY
jgi:hypothetical protein